ncbi:hypothetical protein R1sor_021865 [Riccia sorocarpa]|uniref:U3 small nucleolar RNA-associated protein 6 n=1 Tax=Riccia sorocarpa TaxID=122646 RepID=A0ABD3GMH6_9MARC
MADTVHFHLERMLPELDDLEKRGLFERHEIREIVRKRRDFEYLLKRPFPIKGDFIRYIEFEQNLESLRKLRKGALIRDLKGVKWKASLSDYASSTHIMHIYDRAVKKFKGDTDMWLQYLEYCKAEAPRRFQKVATRCLQLHPNVAGLWIYAAAWEFEHNLNITAARALMQRGLRMCPHSEKLWLEYFRMELTYIQKLKARKVVLGLDGGKPRKQTLNRENPEIEMSDPGESFEEQEKPEVVNEEEDGALSLEDQLSLNLSETIFRNAVGAMPSSVEFRQRFLEVLETYDFEKKGELEANIHASIAYDFPKDEDSWNWLARRHIESRNVGHEYTFLEGKRRAVEVYEESLEAVPSVRMYELYTRFLLDILDMDNEDLDCSSSLDPNESSRTHRHDITDELVTLYKKALAAGVTSEVLIKGYIELLLRNAMVNEAAEMSKKFCEGLETRKFACVWESRITLETDQTSSTTSGEDKGEAISSLFQLAFRSVPLADAKRLYLMAMEFYKGKKSQSDVVISSLEIAMAGGGGGQIGAGIACDVVDWVLSCRGIKYARRTYKRFLALPGPSVELFKHCIKLETRSLRPGSTTEEWKNLRKLYDDALDLYGQNDTDLWLMYHVQEMKAGNVDAAKNVYWRAKKALKDSTEFITRLQLQQIRS